MTLTVEQRKEHVDYIVANCSCWKDGQENLNRLSDVQLAAVRNGVEKEKATTNAATTLPNQVTAVVPPPVVNSTPARPDMNTWLAAMPDEARGVWDAAVEVEKRERAALVGRLTANVADPAKKESKTKLLLNKSVAELRELVELIPTANAATFSGGIHRFSGLTGAPVVPSAPPNYTGAAAPASAPDPNAATGEDLLDAQPTVNWAEWGKKVG